jgi:hypothetical protein
MTMKTIAPKLFLLLPLGCLLGFVGCATAPSVPEVTGEGLARVKDSQADLIYLLPGAQLAGYNKVVLLPSWIAFRKNWQSTINANWSLNQITGQDMQEMIEEVKKLLTEEFTAELVKSGYVVVKESGPDVLAVKPSIVNLDVYAPEPAHTAGTFAKIYIAQSGEATLVLELFDSVTEQLLVRAYDHQFFGDADKLPRLPRTHYTNINDFRNTFGSWAKMLVKELDRAKTAKKPSSGREAP